MRSPIFDIAIHRHDGTHVTTASTRTGEFDPGDVLEGEGFIEWAIDDLRLTPGSYYLSPRLIDQTGLHVLDEQERWYRFQVRSREVPRDRRLRDPPRDVVARAHARASRSAASTRACRNASRPTERLLAEARAHGARDTMCTRPQPGTVGVACERDQRKDGRGCARPRLCAIEPRGEGSRGGRPFEAGCNRRKLRRRFGRHTFAVARECDQRVGDAVHVAGRDGEAETLVCTSSARTSPSVPTIGMVAQMQSSIPRAEGEARLEMGMVQADGRGRVEVRVLPTLVWRPGTEEHVLARESELVAPSHQRLRRRRRRRLCRARTPMNSTRMSGDDERANAVASNSVSGSNQSQRPPFQTNSGSFGIDSFDLVARRRVPSAEVAPRQPERNDIDERAEVGILVVYGHVEPTARSEHAQPVVALSLARAEEEVASRHLVDQKAHGVRDVDCGVGMLEVRDSWGRTGPPRTAPCLEDFREPVGKRPLKHERVASGHRRT